MRTVEHPADFLSPPQRALWDINLVRSFLSYLSPDNSNVVFANPALVYDNQTSLPSAINCTDPRATRHNFNVSSADRLTPYFDSIYAVYCTDPTLIQKWENPGIPEGTFFLPEFQRYAPQDLALLPLPPDHSTVPQLVLDNSGKFHAYVYAVYTSYCQYHTVNRSQQHLPTHLCMCFGSVHLMLYLFMLYILYMLYLHTCVCTLEVCM